VWAVPGFVVVKLLVKRVLVDLSEKLNSPTQARSLATFILTSGG